MTAQALHPHEAGGGVYHSLLTPAWHAKLPPTTTPAWHAKLPLLLTAPAPYQVEQWKPRQVNATTTPLLLLFCYLLSPLYCYCYLLFTLTALLLPATYHYTGLAC